MQTRKAPITFPGKLLMASAISLVFQTGHAELSGRTTVYQEAGKNRVHMEACKRLTKDPVERAKLAKMTLAEAKAKGLALCSRCPGSSTPGKGNPEGGNGGLESWVNPAPDVIAKTSFIPSRLAPLVSLGSDGRLVYKPYSERGDRIHSHPTVWA